MLTEIPQLAAQKATTNAELDAALARLQKQKQAWATLAVREKAMLLDELAEKVGAVSEHWAVAACAAKGIPEGSPLAGEEWLSGPWALMSGAHGYARTLRAVAERGAPEIPASAMHKRPDGQLVVDVFPASAYDSLLLSGITGEVWMEPGVSPENLHDHMAAFYRERSPIGKVALVLGAGNIASIGPLDVLYKLVAEGQVCLLKMNPVNEYLGPFLAEAFASYIARGYVEIAYGGVEVGEYLTAHAAVEEIHITGSARTHDVIVFGPGAEGEARRLKNEPRNTRRVTSELGNVSPIIVVPGPWSAADLRYQAEHIATMKMHNGGFNCVAGQVLVLPETWDLTASLVEEITTVLKALPNRSAYYPGAASRQAAAVSAHPDAMLLDAPAPGQTPRTLVPNVPATKADDDAFVTEAFCSVLSETHLPGATAAEFLANAVRFCNDTLWGTLGCNLLVHPTTATELGPVLEDAIAQLRYGCVAVNAWTGVGFLLNQTSWGAFPGHTLSDVRSGIGVVHNTLLFDRPQKSVVRQSFYPMPRGLLHGSFAILPKPPWFITNTSAATTARRFVAFERAPSVLKLPGIFASALQG